MTAAGASAVSIPAQVKGAGIRPFMESVASHQGMECVARSMAGMPAPFLKHFDARDPSLGVLSSAWYPAEAIHSLLDHVFANLSPTEHRDLVRTASRATISTTLTGVYKWLFTSMMNTDRYAASAQKLFSRYYNTGIMTKTITGPTSHLTVVRHWSGHHPILCDMLLYTGPYVYEALGCRVVTMERTACVSSGAEECRFVVKWQR